MENNELLQQIAALFEQQEERINQRFNQVDDQFRKLELKIEHDVTNKIEALFDGYKLTHEKQWEMERQTEALQKQVDELRARLEALESRIA
ncbi:MAG: hypothetical protein DBY25_08140 [Clostridiales bacterium]|nr:MAG: hypothetical protein DBY25_08140 [Clostridiales bacterium]